MPAAFFEEGHPFLGKFGYRHVGEKQRAVLHAVHAHQLPLGFIVTQSPHVGGADAPVMCGQVGMSGGQTVEEFVREQS